MKTHSTATATTWHGFHAPVAGSVSLIASPVYGSRFDLDAGHGHGNPMWNKPIGHPVPTRRGDPPL